MTEKIDLETFLTSKLGKQIQRASIFVLTVIAITWAMSSLVVRTVELDAFQPGDVASYNVHSYRDFTFDVHVTNADKSEEVIQEIIKQGQVIVRSGDIVTERQAAILEKLHSLYQRSAFAGAWLGQMIVTGLVLLIVYFFLHTYWPHFRLQERDLVFVSVTLIATCLMTRFFFTLGVVFESGFSSIDAGALVLATPSALGGILLEVTLGASGVLLFALSFALIAGIYLAEPSTMMILILLGNLGAALCVETCSRRSSFLRAGFRVAGINAIVVMCLMLLYPAQGFGDGFFRVFCAVLAGALSGVIATGLTPIVEHLGGYVTDIKLLELASLDRPLLRELSLRAPGTLNHSMVMGQMGEAAAEAIGANSLLTRVSAYYHDIGKIKKPDYFVENQRDKENKHDKLTPSMSALIIKAHVKDGIEMAKQHKLPKAIIDCIPEHHGTSLIEYFYDKAMKESEDGEEVDENHYRYPGPKPQTRESGILMLADAVEAATRTLSDPSPTKIQGLVQKMINKIFANGQLSESNLTLKDLHEIAKSFTRVLSGIHHRRVEYAEPAEKVREPKSESGVQEALSQNGTKPEKRESKNGTRHTDSPDGGKEAQEGTSKKSSSKNSKEALKRLGIS